MFQFTQFPLPTLCVQVRVTPHDGCRVSPFGHPRIEAWSTAPRSFSQSPTSFIGSRRLGIHRWLFVAWISIKILRRCSCSLCSSQRPIGAKRTKSATPPAVLRGCSMDAGAGKPTWDRRAARAATFKTEERTGLERSNASENHSPCGELRLRQHVL